MNSRVLIRLCLSCCVMVVILGTCLLSSALAQEVSLIPSSQLDKCNDVDTLWIYCDENIKNMEAADFKISYDSVYLIPSSVIKGPDIGSNDFLQSRIYHDSILINLAVLVGHFDGAGKVAGIILTAYKEVASTSLSFGRSVLRDTLNNNIPHTTSNAIIEIDCTPPNIPVLSTPTDNSFTNNNKPTFNWSSTAGPGGSYTLQYSTTSNFSSGVTTVPDLATEIYTPGTGLADSVWYWHVKAKDKAGNESAYQTTRFSFTVDIQAPSMPTGFAVLPGHQKCKLSWTNPTGDPSFAGVEIRRNPWCVSAYPEYDDFCSAVGYPATHTEGNLVYQGSGASFKDSSSTLTMPRNVYYYAIFSYDSAGNYSTATTAQQGRATNYWLGDVSGDGEVYGLEDLGVLSNAYWTSVGDPQYNAEFDIGPTSNMSPKGIPTTDNVINFEDLAIFAINFAKVGPNQKAVPILAGQAITGPLGLSLVMPEGGLQVGREFKVKVVLSNNPGTVKAIHFVLPYDPAQLEFIGADQSAELKGASYPFFFDGRERGQQVDVSLALLGGNTAIGGSGQIASISFRLLQSKDLSLGFSQIDLRDGENNKLSGQQLDVAYESAVQVPKAYVLSQNYPNPYNLQTQIAYQLPQAGMVLLKIYNIRGQLVRTLVNEYKPAGYHTITWDGKNGDGTAVSSGIYFYRLSSQDFSATRKMVMLK